MKTPKPTSTRPISPGISPRVQAPAPFAANDAIMTVVAPLAAVGPELGWATLAVIVSVGLARLPGVLARL